MNCRSLLISVCLLATVMPALAAGQNIYKFVDKNGVVNYTNVRPKGVAAKVIGTYSCPACKLDSKVDWNATGLNVVAFKDEIAIAARLNEVDESMVRAIIHAESAYRVEALSPAGAQGLMQLMPGTAGMYGVDNAFDAGQNIAAGVKHLRMLLDMFDGDFELAAAGYNAGENAVLRHGGVPPYAETQVYVQRVGVLQKRYATELASLRTASTASSATAAGAL